MLLEQNLFTHYFYPVIYIELNVNYILNVVFWQTWNFLEFLLTKSEFSENVGFPNLIIGKFSNMRKQIILYLCLILQSIALPAELFGPGVLFLNENFSCPISTL